MKSDFAQYSKAGGSSLVHGGSSLKQLVLLYLTVNLTQV